MTNKEKAEEFYNSAIHLVDKNQYLKAVSLLKKAIQYDKDFFEAHLNLGSILTTKLHDYEGAKFHFVECLKLNPQSSAANYNYAMLLAYGFSKYEDSCKYFEKAIKIDNENDLYYNRYAVILFKYLGKTEIAEEFFEKAINLNSENSENFNNYASFLAKQNRIKEAQKYFLLALEKNRNYEPSMRGLRGISDFTKKTFLSEFEIKEVRHQKNIKIFISENEKKHLFLTGKNGSGKTSILKETENYMQQLLEIPVEEIFTEKGALKFWKNTDDYKLKFNVEPNLLDLRLKYESGIFTIVFFGDERKLEKKLKSVNSIQRIDFKLKSLPKEDLSQNLLQFLLWQDYKKKSNIEKEQIERFFAKIQKMLKRIYKDEQLIFEENLQGLEFGESLNFTIQLSNGNKFNLTEMAAGYSAIFEIIFELILRMEAKPEKENTEGIVLIDEPETHLHIEMQKEIMPILIDLFPEVQFIVATHSPFVLSSISNAVIYDLETHIRAEDFSEIAPEKLHNYYFNFSEKYVRVIEKKVEKFEKLVKLYTERKIEESDKNKLAELEIELDEVTPYISNNYYLKFKENQAKLFKND